MNQLRALWGKRIGGVPVPVILVVLVTAAYLVFRRRQATAKATDVQPDDTSKVDESKPVGAMMGDSGGGTGFDAPQPYGPGGASSDDGGGFFSGAPIYANPDAGDTTATGAPVGKVSDPTKKIPPKKKPQHSSHPAGHHEPPKKAPHPHAAKPPAKKTTVHRARPTSPRKPKLANPRKPAPPKQAARKAAPPRPAHPQQPIRRGRG